jgi:hypothetical protein
MNFDISAFAVSFVITIMIILFGVAIGSMIILLVKMLGLWFSLFILSFGVAWIAAYQIVYQHLNGD